MSLCRDSSLPTTVSSSEDAVREAFGTCAEVALESLETEGLLDWRRPSTEAARIKLGTPLLPRLLPAEI